MLYSEGRNISLARPVGISTRQRMQDVDRPDHVEALALPTRHRGSRMQDQPRGIVACAEVIHGIGGDGRGRRDLGHELAVRAAELERTVRLSIKLVAFLMDRAVMTATQQGEIRERGGASIGPMDLLSPVKRFFWSGPGT
jgi:hypothetical protein